MSVATEQYLDSQHSDMVHDAVLDFYGKRLATCSSDKTIHIYDIKSANNFKLIDTLLGHEGPIWQLAWAHPKFGSILASAGYDGRVIIWREQNNQWTKLVNHTLHQSSVNSVSWAPHELGAILVCSSSDGKVSILEFKDDGTWHTRSFDAHAIGCNAASWAPTTSPGSLFDNSLQKDQMQRAFVTAGCDNLVKIWTFYPEADEWKLTETFDGHSDWVRDVAWAPNIGLPLTMIASASQDKHVYIWHKELDGDWKKTDIRPEGFSDVAWRVSWSHSGNVLAISCGKNKVYLYKETLDGWEMIREIEQN